MSACLMTVTLSVGMIVYGPDLATPVDRLSTNDQVCVTRIENGWTEIHFDVGNIGRTGYIKDMVIKPPATPSAPAYREEPYQVAPPAPQQEPQSAPQQYRSPQAPNPDFVVRPTTLVMQCFPEHSQPYAVVYLNGQSGITTKTGKPHYHDVLEEKDNQSNHIFYVKAEGAGGHTLFYAFDYSQRGNDVSAIRVMGNGYDAKDKCWMDWELTK